MNGSRVLVIEDSPSQAEMIAEIARASGHDVSVYTSLALGVTQILELEAPEVVLLDLRLLDERGQQIADGFHVCREIKRFSPDVAVIVVTAEDREDACEWAVLQGADAYLQKPFEPDELNMLIEQVLELKQV
jgi:twitching motility two-component system response regulator PilH